MMPFRIFVVGVVSGLLCLYLVHIHDHATRFGGPCIHAHLAGGPPIQVHDQSPVHGPGCRHAMAHCDDAGHECRPGYDDLAVAGQPSPAARCSAPDLHAAIDGDTLLVDVKRTTIEELLMDGDPLGQVRLTPDTDRHGRDGLAIAAVTGDGLPGLIGLRQGDVLLTLNGHRLPSSIPELLALYGGTDMARWPEAMAHDERADRASSTSGLPNFVDIGIERHGLPVRILMLMHE